MESTQKPEILKEEFYGNLTGKLLLASIGAWLVGKSVNTKIRGTQQEIRVIANALMASKRFQEELRRPGATVESVSQKLRLKHMSAVEFEKIMGVRWPL
jgi:hypothetical protein